VKTIKSTTTVATPTCVPLQFQFQYSRQVMSVDAQHSPLTHGAFNRSCVGSCWIPHLIARPPIDSAIAEKMGQLRQSRKSNEYW